MSDITLEKAKKQIENAIAQNGPYSHNIVGLVLSEVASSFGEDVANDLVVAYALTTRYGIRPVEKSSVAVKQPVKEKTREELRAERETREAAERKAKRQVLVGKLVNLANEIEALAPGYLKYKEVEQQWGDAEVYLEARSDKYENEYARVVYKRGWSGWHETDKVYVRIETSDWEHQFKRNWTFDTKDLAKKVLEKVRALLAEIEAKKDYRNSSEEKNKKSIAYLTETYGKLVGSMYRTGSQTRGRLTVDEENYRTIDFTFDLEEKTYHVTGLPTLTEEQFKKIVGVIRGV